MHGGDFLREGKNLVMLRQVLQKDGIGYFRLFPYAQGVAVFPFLRPAQFVVQVAFQFIKGFAGACLQGDVVTVGLELLPYGLHGPVQNDMRLVDEGDVVAYFLNGCHVVGGEDDGMPFRFQFQDFLFQPFRIDGVESAERLVPDEQPGFMDDRDDELHFLLHAF